MKGNNRLILNQVTMKEAMQLYFDRLFGAQPNCDKTVLNVEEDGVDFAVDLGPDNEDDEDAEE